MVSINSFELQSADCSIAIVWGGNTYVESLNFQKDLGDATAFYTRAGSRDCASVQARAAQSVSGPIRERFGEKSAGSTRGRVFAAVVGWLRSVPWLDWEIGHALHSSCTEALYRFSVGL